MAIQNAKKKALFLALNIIFGIILYSQLYIVNKIDEYQDKIIDQQHNLYKNYLINISIVNDKHGCSSKQIKAQGDLDNDGEHFILRNIEITDKVNNKTSIYQICFEVYNFYSFANLAGKKNLQDIENTCQYKGINFQSEILSNRCPISEFFISDQDQEELYEKIQISKDSKFSLFIKRSNPNKTPAVDIKFLKEEEQHLPQSDTNISFQINSLCRNQQFQNKSFCKEQNELPIVNVYLENQISLNAQCYSALLFFDSYILYTNSSLFRIVLSIVNALFFFAFFFISSMLINTKKSLKYGLHVFQALAVLHLYSFYPLHQDFSYIKNTIKDNCFLEYNPLRSIYEKANQFNNFYIFNLFFIIFLIVLPFKLKINNKQQKKQPGQNILTYEMAAA